MHANCQNTTCYAVLNLKYMVSCNIYLVDVVAFGRKELSFACFTALLLNLRYINVTTCHLELFG